MAAVANNIPPQPQRNGSTRAPQSTATTVNGGSGGGGVNLGGPGVENTNYTIAQTDDFGNHSEPVSSNATPPPAATAAPVAGTAAAGTKKGGIKPKKPLDPTEVRIRERLISSPRVFPP
jgi:hypothetical protein